MGLSKALCLLAAGFFMAAGCQKKGVDVSKPEIKISAQELFKAYRTDRKEADKKYKGKILEVTGIVEKTGQDIGKTFYVSLRGEPGQGDVQCFFEKKDAAQAAKLQKGQQVTLRGQNTVYVIHPLLEFCQISG